MNNSQTKRMWIVLGAIVFATAIIVGRLVVFQLIQGEEWSQTPTETIVARPERGIIYDRNGAVLAANGADYQIGASPNLIVERDEVATALAPILELSRFDILASLEQPVPFVLLSGRVSSEKAEAIRTLDYDGIQIDALPRRIYPQGDLLSHVLGYVDFENYGRSGIEARYNAVLAGESAVATVPINPQEEQPTVIAREGADIVLTIDRSVQHLVETHLDNAIRQYGAEGGTIIVMDPRTGAILALANAPDFDPYSYFEAPDEGLLVNPAVSRQYEPGSVMKLITMALALDSGAVSPESSYYDPGFVTCGATTAYNSDRSAPGQTTMTNLLAYSRNVGAATIAKMTTTDTYYNYMKRFGFGRPTGIDLEAEISGTLHLPGDELWTEDNLCTNAFGQGIAVTPIQMISSISALANEGYQMQPYLVQEIHYEDRVHIHEPTVMSRPITPETARMVTSMSINAVNIGIWNALVDGYTVAGKTGTSQIPENGVYLLDKTIASFIGWLPGDAPEVVILYKIDRPTASIWGSETAAPSFARLAEEIVVLLDIPPDSIRLQADIMQARENN